MYVVWIYVRHRSMEGMLFLAPFSFASSSGDKRSVQAGRPLFPPPPSRFSSCLSFRSAVSQSVSLWLRPYLRLRLSLSRLPARGLAHHGLGLKWNAIYVIHKQLYLVSRGSKFSTDIVVATLEPPLFLVIVSFEQGWRAVVEAKTFR